MKPIIHSSLFLVLGAVSAFAAGAIADPDGKSGDLSKPVKVYVLAGQSNMVGMGNIRGALPPYPSIFLSSDPAIIPGVMHAGSRRFKGACRWFWKGEPALRAHGLYQNAEGDATGAIAVSGGKTSIVKLGQVNESITGPGTVATAYIDVPETGNYLVHVGYDKSSQAMATVNGSEVYRKDAGGKATLTKTALEAGKRHKLEITYAQGGSAALWLEQIDLVGKGDLMTLTHKDGKFPYLVDDKGEWTTRNDVTYREARVMDPDTSGPLTATSNGVSIGPELGFGFVMGTYHDEQVLLIKTAMGNRALRFDFRPPSSGRTDPNSEWEGLEYRLMVKGVKETLAKIDQYVPGYKGQGYEIAGFCWFQGHKDSGSTKEDYESCLVNLIQDLRKDLNAPDMKAVVATVGFYGYRLMSGPWKGVWEAQMAVGNAKQHPEFAGNVASVDTRDFWRDLEESPRNQDYHYHRNPETYLLTGEAMGRAMVRLLGGKAEEPLKSDREAKAMAAIAAEASSPAPTPERIAASHAACKPMVLDGLLQTYLAGDAKQEPFTAAMLGIAPKPDQAPEFLDDAIDDVAAIYQESGSDQYNWHTVLPAMAKAEWEILGFDLANNPYNQTEAAKPTKGKKAKPAPLDWKVPAGQEQWFAKDFDAAKAGWKKAPAPFGKAVDKQWPEKIAWIVKYPLYPAERPQPATVTEHDVLLMRGNFELPPAKEGHRYRVRVSGSINANSGEGFAIYVNGRLMGEQHSGVTAWREQGLRGCPVWQEFSEDFKGGPVTLAIANFPMSNWIPGDDVPAIGPLAVTIEEQRLPDLDARP